ncbi:MAG TPA: amidohydrolase family protein [Pyrinomonadaceae bacterium]|nr:amidohydrolase family protein [Pyrinomonadaceae bacterium]
MTKLRLRLLIGCILIALTTTVPFSSSANASYDIVILNGRVIDPESQLDAIRNIGITGATIKAISKNILSGRVVIDAKGLTVSPGFIDLHQHGQNEENYRFKAMDGVTTALELEVGTGDVDAWYAERAGKAFINYGVSAGHLAARMAAMKDKSEFLPTGEAARRAATPSEIAEMKSRLERGLQRGALAVGFGIQYVPQASHWEILEMFRVAARFNASCHVHLRNAGIKEPASSVEALEEVIAAASLTGAPLHVVHIASTGGKATPQLLQLIAEARARGLDVTTECYPYIAGMTEIQSAIFNQGWQEVFGIDYGDLQWAATGERLTKESFERYRKTGGMVAVFSMTEEIVEAAIRDPLTMIASDGILDQGKGHPRTAGTYTRVLGRYVRERGDLTLMEAIRKMTLAPAQRLERRAPSMKNKGRIRLGADADIVVFDAQHVIDRSTYEDPAKYAEGMKYVLVNGVPVVKDGQLQNGVNPGQPVRAPY